MVARFNWVAVASALLASGARATYEYGYTANLIPLQENAGTVDLFPMPECFGFRLEEATIDEMQKAMESGALTSVQLVQCYMIRTYQTEEYIK